MTAIDSLVWEQIPGLAREVALGADGSAWCLGLGETSPDGYSIHRWNSGEPGASGDWDHVAGAAVKIAVACDGFPWIVNRQGQLSRLTPHGWEPLPGLAREIACGPDGSVWCLSAADFAPGGGSIHVWNPGRPGQAADWNHVDGAGVKISVAGGGVPWIVNSAGQVFRRSGEGWQLLAGLAGEIACGAEDEIWCLSAAASTNGERSIHSWNGSDWNHVPGNAVKIAADGRGKLLIADGEHRIFRTQSATGP
jgi:hypothetical protein